jgi:glycosyltransferase involved in cell wall biosynthesis
MATRGVVPLAAGCGGAEIAAYQVAKAMARRGHEVTLVTDHRAADFPPVAGLQFVGIESRLLASVKRLPGGFFGWMLQHLVGNVTTARRVRKLLRSKPGYDVVHVHGNLAAVLISRFVRVPLVYTEHDATPWICRYRRWWERMIRKTVYGTLNAAAFRRADRIAVVFESLRTEIVERWRIPPERVMTIVNGIDVDVFNPERPGASVVRERCGFERYCLFVGRLTPRKAPDLLVRALAEADGVRCAFVGDGPMRRRLEALAAELGVADRVAFLGNLPHGDLSRIYADADFVVVPSVSEGTPLVVAEAMACGTAVLATRVAGLPDLVEDWETGFLVKPGDSGQLAVALRFLDSDPAKLERMGAKAQRRARRLLWPQLTEHYLELYASVTGEGSPGARPAQEIDEGVPVRSP